MSEGDACLARKNLVVVRAGSNSLHPAWLGGAEERNWDLIVSVYDPEAHFEQRDGVCVVMQRGGKWDGLYALFADGDLLRRYEYIWLPDDDIETRKEDINSIFAAMRQYNLEVAQPALTPDSYFSHFICMQCPGFTLRYSNFVETMVPCISSALLAKVLDDFRESESGFGLDSVWCRRSSEPRYKAAILDFVAVHHTRPVGKMLASLMASRGKSPVLERELLLKRYGLRGRQIPRAYAALDARNRRIEGCTRTGWKMALRYFSILGKFRKKNVALEKIFQIIRRQTFQKVDLTTLRRS